MVPSMRSTKHPDAVSFACCVSVASFEKAALLVEQALKVASMPNNMAAVNRFFLIV
jgi:hypothetical protein